MGGHDGGRSRNLVTFNINLFSIKKSYFWFPMLSSVTMATSCQGVLEISEVIIPYVSLQQNFKSFQK